MNAGLPTCPVCACPVQDGQPRVACPTCEALHHEDCWAYNDGCAIYACAPAGLPAPAAARTLPAVADLLLEGDRPFGVTTDLSTRVVALATAAVAALIFSALTSVLPGVIAFVALVLFPLLLRDTATFDPDRRALFVLHQLGPAPLLGTLIPFADVEQVTLRRYVQESGWLFRSAQRVQVRLRGGRTLGFTLDPEREGLDPTAVAGWAQALGRQGGFRVVRAPEPRRPVLLKRLTGLTRLFDEESPRFAWALALWRLRWVLAPALATLTTAATSTGGARAARIGLDAAFAGMGFWGFLALFAFLSAVCTFVTPSTVLTLFRDRSRLDPNPRPWTDDTEERNLATVDSVLALAQEKAFFSLLAPSTRLGLLLAVNALPAALPFVPTVVGRVAVLALLAAVSGELTRALWDEAWTRAWLESTLRDLEPRPPHAPKG